MPIYGRGQAPPIFVINQSYTYLFVNHASRDRRDIGVAA